MNTAVEHLGALGTAVKIPKKGGGAQLWNLFGSEWLNTGDSDDIYMLLNGVGRDAEDRHTPYAMGVLTTGWAAPLGDDGTIEGVPSEHPKRRRVVLFCVVTRDGDVASRMLFEDTPNEPVDDDGAATGALAEAIDAMALRVWGRSFILQMFANYEMRKEDMPEEQRQRLAGRLSSFVQGMVDEDFLASEQFSDEELGDLLDDEDEE
jgi:hypothetical protein